MKIEDVLSNSSINQAIRHTCRKKGAPGFDHMTVKELPAFWENHGEQIKERILNGTYFPKPVITYYIPKPGKKEKRKLEVPCIVDRMISYSIHMTVSPYYESQFNKFSFGFRKGMGCPDALNACFNYINKNTDYIVDLDIEKFYDNVDHEILFQLLRKDNYDTKLLLLIERYVKVTIFNGKKYQKKRIGLPQGSSVSPLLANIFLDEFDHYMETIHARFIRYADDVVIFCETRDEAEKKLILANEFLTKTLKLHLNQEKTKIVRPWELNYLGYCFKMEAPHKYVIAIDAKTKSRMLEQMEKNMNRSGLPLEELLQRLGGFNRGWINYYKDIIPAEMISFLLLVEHYQIKHFNEKINNEDNTVSCQYINAFYNCKGYSSLTGWYQKKILNQYGNLPGSVDQMANKYTYWRSNSFYEDKKTLAKFYSFFLQKPFYYNFEKCILGISLYNCNTPFAKQKQPNNSELLILGLLAAGKNMTFFQLKSYLALKGINWDQECLIHTLNQLGDKGLLEKRIIYQRDPSDTSNKIAYSNHFMCYSIAFEGKKYIEQIGAPTDYKIKPLYPDTKTGRLIYLYTSTILWNQIILNYTLYDPSFQFFQICTPLHFSHQNKMEIPLCIQTEQRDFIFEYTHQVDKEIVRNIYKKWQAYKKCCKREIAFVLITDTYQKLNQSKYFSLVFSSTIRTFRKQIYIFLLYIVGFLQKREFLFLIMMSPN